MKKPFLLGIMGLFILMFAGLVSAVTLTFPDASALVNGTFTLNATNFGTSGVNQNVTNCTFYYDSTAIGTDFNTTRNDTNLNISDWDSSSITSGTYTFNVTCRFGNMSNETSANTGIIVDNTNPAISISTDSLNIKTRTAITSTCTGSDTTTLNYSQGLVKPDTSISTQALAVAVWNENYFQDIGSYTLTCYNEDQFNKTASASATITTKSGGAIAITYNPQTSPASIVTSKGGFNPVFFAIIGGVVMFMILMMVLVVASSKKRRR